MKLKSPSPIPSLSFDQRFLLPFCALSNSFKHETHKKMEKKLFSRTFFCWLAVSFLQMEYKKEFMLNMSMYIDLRRGMGDF